jgi:phenylalanyl-tRNA synthetase beta chain
MIASLQWLKECYSFEMPMQQLADGLTMLGIEVESIRDDAAVYAGFVTGKVLHKEAHPNADSLSLCTVTNGSQESVIICGAPNVAAGQTVIIAQSGAIVPNGGFAIGKRKIRGIESNGMICSKFELNLGEDDGGIWVLPEETPIGMPLAEMLGMNDIILEIGITPNRADCLSHIGLSREIAILAGGKEKVNIPGKEQALLAYEQRGNEGNPSISIEDPELCHRYIGLKINGVSNGESPEWLKRRIESIGLRPKNIIVDISNYVMYETGQPLHTFDADLIAGNTIIVKRAYANQEFETLDGKSRILDDRMLLICDTEKPIAIAGVMGGKNSEISDATTSVFIESAYFQPSSIRRTAKQLGISSDAAYRFERGVDINMLPHAALRAAQMIIELAGGKIADAMHDAYPHVHEAQSITIRVSRASAMLGKELDTQFITTILESIDCSILSSDEDSVTIAAPSHRIDINEEIDLIEEIARIIGYDNLPQSTDVHFPGDAAINTKLQQPSLRNRIRYQLMSMGMQEIVTYSFMDAKKAEAFTDGIVMIKNPLGEEFSAMRPSLIPASLDIIARNWNAGQKNLALFDIGRVFHTDATVKDSISTLAGFNEREHLLITLTGNAANDYWKDKNRALDFYDAKGIAEAVLKSSDVHQYASSTKIPADLAPASIMSPNAIAFSASKQTIACAGQLLPAYCKSYDCAMPVFAIIIDLTALYQLKKSKTTFSPISVFPAVERDLAFIVDTEHSAKSIIETAKNSAGSLLKQIDVFDVFEGASLGEGKKSLGLRFRFQSSERTLIEEEINIAISSIVNAVQSTYQASLRSI